MKIRWTRNSVRLCITPSELEDLQRGREVVELLLLPDGSWNATIRPDAHQTSLFVEHGALILLLAAAAPVVVLRDESAGAVVEFEVGIGRPIRHV